MKPIRSTLRSRWVASMRPLRVCRARSICVTSPVTMILEPLPGRHGRAHAHNALHLPLPQEVDRHRDREVRLARARRADAKDEVVVLHRPDVAGLAVGARPDEAAALERRQALGTLALAAV